MSSETEVFFKNVCNDRRCSTVLYATRSNPSVDCFRCGQKMLCNFNEEVLESERKDAAEAFHRQGLISRLQPKRGTEMVKVLGLSNYYCKLLSPLLTEYGMERSTGKAKRLKEMNKGDIFDCSLFGDRAFLIEPEHIEIPGFGRDITGSMNYLNETLQIIKASNGGQERLLPIHVDGDGHCLVHAISRALVGRELFWHPLRCCLKRYLELNLDKLQEEFKQCGFDWQSIIRESDPDYKPAAFHGLTPMHIFGLANVLRRPIVLLDSYECMKNNSAEYSALFLPFLIGPDGCKGKDNTLNKPICIAWSNKIRNHYIPLVGVDKMPLPVLPKSLLPGVYGNPQVELECYIQFDENDNCTIGGNRVLSDSYIQQLVRAMEGQYFVDHEIHPSIVEDIKLLCNNIEYDNITVMGIAKTIVSERLLYRCTTCHALNGIPKNENLLSGYLHTAIKFSKNYGYDPSGDVYMPDMFTSKKEKCFVCQGTSLLEVKPDGSLVQQLYEQKNIPQKSGDKSAERTEDLPKMLTLKIEKNNIATEDVIPDCKLVKAEALEGAVLHIASNFIKKHFPDDVNNAEFLMYVRDEVLKKIGKTLPVPSASEVMPPLSDKAKIPVVEKIMEATPMAEQSNFNDEPKPSTSELQIIKIVSPNGDQANVQLNDKVLTYSYLQECIFKEFQIPIENQRIKIGFPPKVLEAPHNNVNQALPLKHGDRLMVENCSRQENKSRNTPYIRNTARDFSSQSNVNAAIKNEMLWSIAKLNPEQFCKGGCVYEEIARNKILTDMVHMFIETFPNKTFAYNSKEDCIELCFKPLGHFLISPDLDSRIDQVQQGEAGKGYRTCPVMSLKTGHKAPTPSRSVKKPVGTNTQTSSENVPAPLVRKGPGFSVLTSPDSSERMDLT